MLLPLRNPFPAAASIEITSPVIQAWFACRIWWLVSISFLVHDSSICSRKAGQTDTSCASYENARVWGTSAFAIVCHCLTSIWVSKPHWPNELSRNPHARLIYVLWAAHFLKWSAKHAVLPKSWSRWMPGLHWSIFTNIIHQSSI